jgi:peroxiredoxin
MSKVWNAGIGFSLVAFATVAVLLGVEVRSMRAEFGLFVENASAMAPGSLAPITDAIDLEGNSVLLGSSVAQVRVYLVFNTQCPFCPMNVPFWTALSERYRSVPEVEVLGISLDSAEATVRFQEEHRLLFRTVVLADPRHKQSHRFDAVPQTVVLDSSGRVAFVRVGVIDSEAAADSVHAEIVAVLHRSSGQPVE